MNDFAQLTAKLLAFRDERNWKQFHSLKDLIISLNLEAGELLELTQWKPEAELQRLKADPGFQENLRDECDDVLLYLLLIAEEAGIDLVQAAESKLVKNAVKYPVDRFYGSAKKYSDDSGK